jgi:glycolate oxidase FAD binding subunit
MTTATGQFPITETFEPADQQELIGVVKECYESNTAIYPVGGGTSLEFGLPAKRNGIGLSLAKLNRIVDYPARDMTITVEAGVTMKTLAETLATERQRLPIDVPHADRATIGGVVATNWNGPRRYGHGTVRDHVIGISAVDGHGLAFKGGGRVVKNVAGYDFCKLLTGSLGTLGVITQLTLKLKPMPERSVLMVCELADLDQAEKLLAALVHSETTPAAIELLAGPAWDNDETLRGGAAGSTPGVFYLVVGLEGTVVDVDWMCHQLAKEWGEFGVLQRRTIAGELADELWQKLAEFSAAGESPLVLKASVVPSAATRFVRAVREVDANCAIQAHAGNGIVIVRFSAFPEGGLSRTLIGKLEPVASATHGNVVILSNPSGGEMTHQSVWGGIDAPFPLMTAVKQQFDPKDLLNPGRFVYTPFNTPASGGR